MTFIHKQFERAAYLFLLLSLASGWCTVKFLILISPILRKRKPSKDFLFFPYTHKDSAGTNSRFQQNFPLLDKDGYKYEAHFASTEESYNNLYFEYHPSRAYEYWFYHKIFWQRLGWVLKARNFKAVFFQRALFTYYYE
jgi:hypothetical protein